MSDNPFQEEINDADMPQFSPPPPPRASSPGQSLATSPQGLSKLEQLRARESELLRRQQELQVARDEIIASPNYPSFFPVFVFNLARDISPRAHSCLQHALYGLCAIIVSAIFNIITVMCVWGLPTFHHVRSMIFALIQGFGTGYLVFNYSFLRLYDSCKRKDIPFSWILIQFAVVGWTVYLTIGFPDSGCVGLATFLDLLAKSRFKFSMLMAFLNTVFVASAAFFEFVALYKAQTYQKVSGQEEDVAPRQA
jgi:hypothetical protein